MLKVQYRQKAFKAFNWPQCTSSMYSIVDSIGKEMQIDQYTPSNCVGQLPNI